MKIGFHYHIPAIVKEDGLIYLPGYLGVFLDGLAREVAHVTLYLHSPMAHELEQMDYALCEKNITLKPVGPHVSFYNRIRKRKLLIEAIKKDKEELDIVLLRGPSPLLPFVAHLCLKNNISFSYLLVGDYLKTLQGASALSSIKKNILGVYYYLNKYYQDKFAKNALLFANNQVIYEEYKAFQPLSHLIRTTTLNSDDIYHRYDTCENTSIQLIYAGRIEPTKGMEDVLEAMSRLSDLGREIILNLVGWDPSANDTHLKYLFKKASELGLSKQLVFHGKKKVGEELFSMYRQSDIFILATKGNEGFPRTIWEAMASSLPVIATKVGSIPFVLEDRKHACLINEAAPDEMALRIRELIETPLLRQELISNGLVLAKDNTNEVQARNMVSIMKEYLKDKCNV